MVESSDSLSAAAWVAIDSADSLLEEKGWPQTELAQSKIRRAPACWVGWSCGLAVRTPLAIGEDSSFVLKSMFMGEESNECKDSG